jgi:hypothetical protein
MGLSFACSRKTLKEALPTGPNLVGLIIIILAWKHGPILFPKRSVLFIYLFIYLFILVLNHQVMDKVHEANDLNECRDLYVKRNINIISCL